MSKTMDALSRKKADSMTGFNANIPTAPGVKADPNDPDFKRVQKGIFGALLLGRGFVSLTPTPVDDEWFEIIQQVISENYERCYDLYRARHPKK